MPLTAPRAAVVLGAAYLAFGLLGFAVTGLDDLASAEGADLLFVRVNPLQNGFHALIGVSLLAAAGAGESVARQVAVLVGLVLAIVGLVGFLITDDPTVNVLAVDAAGNVIHVATAVAAFAAISSARRVPAEESAG